MWPQASCRRLVFHQWTQRAVASSTCSTVRQGPWRLISSVLYSQLTELGEGVVVAVAAAADRAHGVRLGQALGVPDREVPGGLNQSSQHGLSCRV